MFFGCKNTVTHFDDRLSSKFSRKGFSAQSIDKNGHHIYYWDNQKKNAPVVIFVHGFGGDGKTSWMKQAFDFSDDYRVIIPDILWFGNSYSSKKPALSSQIQTLRTLVQSLEIEKVNLCGLSYGGFIVLGYAQKFTQDLNSLCIVDSPGPVISNNEVQEFCNRVGVPNIKEAFVPETSSDVKRLMNFAFHKSPFLPKFIRKQTLGIYFSKYPKEQKELLDNLPENRGSMPSKTIMPTLILWGEEDEVFNKKNAKALQDAIGAELTIFSNAGHSLPYEKSKAFNKRYRQFLERK